MKFVLSTKSFCKKALCIILLLLVSFSAHAAINPWDLIKSCVSDPCDCGQNNYYEAWDGDVIDKGKPGSLCPPYNKLAGRGDHMCLSASDVPKFGVHHQYICAEETPESNYFSPKIRVRGQFCNTFACWTKVKSLEHNGQCITWPGPYGLPLIRMCARVAFQGDEKEGLPADMGYTEGKHLNFEGVEVDDEILEDINGDVIDYKKPKLCAYYDPAFMDPKTLDLDLFDINPLKQTFHKTTEVHPIIKVLILIINTAVDIASAPSQLIGSMIGMANTDESTDGGKAAQFFKDIFTHLNFLFELYAEGLVAILEEIGQINRVVSDNHYGCVELPIGPMPPPCCDDIPKMIQKPNLNKICPLVDPSTRADSIDGRECLTSNVKNGAISNGVRVGFNRLVPICRNGEDPTKTDKCVLIENIGAFASASILHVTTAELDVLKHCNDAVAGEPCVLTKMNYPCHFSENGCNQGIRIVYGSMIGDKIVPSPYYMNDLQDCGSPNQIICQSIWGVNMGEFVDVNLKFPMPYDADDLEPIIKKIQIYDSSSMLHDVELNIVREEVLKGDYFTQSPSQICAYENAELLSCIDRAPINTFSAIECNGSNCKKNAEDPEMELIITDHTENLSVITSVVSFENYDSANPLLFEHTTNILGFKFNSFVTDENFTVVPFTGEKALNSLSLYGKYKDNEVPFIVDEGGIVTSSDDAVYLSGLEYINGYYYRGGEYVCTKPVDLESCPVDTTQCVLTKLAEPNVVNCKDFFEKASIYLGFRLCSSEEETGGVCTNVSSLPKKNDPNTVAIHIKQCGNYYCYTGGKELCKVSNKAQDRMYPAASLGLKIPASEYYDINATGADGKNNQDYDRNKYALRSKTPMEMGLCVARNTPVCDEIIYNALLTNPSWPETKAGEVADGYCAAGYEPVDPNVPLKRLCIYESSTSAKFESNNQKCKKIP